MTRFAVLSAVALMAASAAVPALAQQSRAPAQPRVEAQRVVMLCESDAATRSAFRREYGQAPVFVTADQALQARSRGEVWATPRCMNAREHTRLVQTLGSFAAVR